MRRRITSGLTVALAYLLMAIGRVIHRQGCKLRFWNGEIGMFKNLKALWARLLAALKDPKNDPWWQALHFAAGMMFPLAGASFGGIYAAVWAGSGHQTLACVLCWAALATIAGGVVWVVPKEFAFDIYVEGATFDDGWRDAGSYWKGIITSWVILLLMVWALGAS